MVAHELLAVGDVNYGGRFRSVVASVLFRGVQELRRDTLEDLPASGDEVEAVRSALKDMDGLVLSHPTATETNFKHDASKPLAVIHLAVHALVDTKYPDRAALVFAPDPRPAKMGYSKFGK